LEGESAVKKGETAAGHLLALFCVVVWGTTFLVSKKLLESFTPAQVMMMRFFLAYLMLWILYPHWRFSWREEGWFLLMSLFSNTLYFLSENTALMLTQTSNVSILVSTAPILTVVLLSVFHRDEHVEKRELIGFLAAFAGVVLVVFNGTVVLKLNPLGDVLAFCAALCWALYGLLLRRCSGKYSSFLISRKLMFYGMLTGLPVLAVQRAPMNWAALASWGSLAGIGYLALIGSAVCYVAWNSSVERLGVRKTNLYIYAIPLVTLAAGAALLHERVTLMGAAGTALVVGGMVLGSLPERSAEARAS
jgi:drug/metabolite transporter (DMT)-like permease